MHRRHYSEEEQNAVISRYAAGGEEVKSMLAEYGIPKSNLTSGYGNMISVMGAKANMISPQGISVAY